MKQQTISESQFGNAAERYLTSPVHAQGGDLKRLATLAGRIGPAKALDLGCGAGHASFALASSGAHVTACDPSANMLEVVSREAKRRGLPIETVLSPAEQLPFEDASFDLIVTRYSAHHWRDLKVALAEAARVLVPGGKLVVIDSIAPEEPLFDTILQTIELLRDASHVRNYRISEWKSMLEDAGFSVGESDVWMVRIEFESWITRLNTPPARAEALRAVFPDIPDEAQRYFGIGQDYSFDLGTAWVGASRCQQEAK
ncbi:MAG: class I SAM-dependent methyltransferase [Burkholderiales bacterium]